MKNPIDVLKNKLLFDYLNDTKSLTPEDIEDKDINISSLISGTQNKDNPSLLILAAAANRPDIMKVIINKCENMQDLAALIKTFQTDSKDILHHSSFTVCKAIGFRLTDELEGKAKELKNKQPDIEQGKASKQVQEFIGKYNSKEKQEASLPIKTQKPSVVARIIGAIHKIFTGSAKRGGEVTIKLTGDARTIRAFYGESTMKTSRKLILSLINKHSIKYDVGTLNTKLSEVINSNKTDKKGIIIELIEKGADVNSKDEKGFSALYYATKKGDLEMVKLLMDKGANKDENALKASQDLERNPKNNIIKRLVSTSEQVKSSPSK